MTAGCAPSTPATPSSDAPSTTAAVASATPSSEPATSPSASTHPTASPNESTDDVAVDPPQVEPSPTAGASVADVDVLLTSWGVEGREFAATAVVEGVVAPGTCTLTMERDGVKETASGPSARSASSSSCAEGMTIPLNDLGSGTWTVTIGYAAEGFAGASEEKAVAVP